MTTIDTGNSVFQDLSIEQKGKQAEKGGNELGQKAFLKLMITQLENQDPLSPQENSEFIAQLAQFSSVEGLERLNGNFDSFAQNFVDNQALQASSLVGRSVSVKSDEAQLEGGKYVNALVDVPARTLDLIVNIYDEAGALKEQIPVGESAAGELALRWDGKKMSVNGQELDWRSEYEGGLPPGHYGFTVTSTQEGKNTQLDTYLSANVNSVTVGANGALSLNLAGVGTVSLDDVKQFNQ